MINIKRVASASVLLLALSNNARAQLPWETPSMLAPHAPRGFGILAASYAAAPNDGWGALLIWRKADAPTGLGFRLAAGQGRGDRPALAAGVEGSAWIARVSDNFPVDMIWTTGIGGSYGSSAQIALPVGVSAGRSFSGDAVWFNPYAASRVIVEGRFGGRAPADELDLQLATELGANISFDRNRRFIVRLAAAIGDRSALAVGAHLGGGRLRNVHTAETANRQKQEAAKDD
jgi:hypothetical protein